LARLSHPFLLDAARNPILVIDWPCGASPPPGLACTQSPDEVVAYLQGQGIRYLAYDYAEQAGFSLAFGGRLDPEGDYFERISAEHTFRFQDLLVEVGNRQAVIHDDGGAFVVDLQRPRGESGD
jgi:hypothetical protein